MKQQKSKCLFRDDATLMLLAPSDPALKEAAATRPYGGIGSGGRCCSGDDRIGCISLRLYGRCWQRILVR